MDAFSAEWIADDWIDAWNAHDLERILSHYSEDVTLSSEMVRTVTGRDDLTVIGKPALREYWRQGLARFPDLHFQPIHAFPGARSLVLVYHAVSGLIGAEFMRLNTDGKICEVHAHYRSGGANER
ncbi:nuclear transport factor 2 family protein [Lysobacter sp. HA18]